jgi:hypothetical protein
VVTGRQFVQVLFELLGLHGRGSSQAFHTGDSEKTFLRIFENFVVTQEIKRIRRSSVGIATAWMVGVRFPAGIRDFFFTACRPALGPTQPPIQWVPGVKRPGREADHSPPSSAEVKNGGAMPPLPYTSSWRGA